MSGGRSLEMAASCPGPAHCGTAHPAWLDPASLGPGPAPGTVSSPVYMRTVMVNNNLLVVAPDVRVAERYG